MDAMELLILFNIRLFFPNRLVFTLTFSIFYSRIWLENPKKLGKMKKNERKYSKMHFSRPGKQRAGVICMRALEKIQELACFKQDFDIFIPTFLAFPDHKKNSTLDKYKNNR